jgi:crossover junction endodeoxyribonuclease RusA
MVGVIRFILPLAPSINHYFARNGNRTFLPAKVREYRQEVADIVAAAGHATLEGRLQLFIAVHMPDKRRRDLDNVLKGAIDALMHAGVFLDDEQVDHIQVIRQEIIKGGRMVVLITEVEK